MAFSFTIPNVGEICPDKGFGRSSTPSVHKISFGDGYEQRTRTGINNIAQTYSVTFNNRPDTEIDNIINYFDSLGGVEAFQFTVDTTTIKVVCENYSTTFIADGFSSCTASFRRVYEP